MVKLADILYHPHKLYLNEGLLKVPQKLSGAITSDAVSFLASKYATLVGLSRVSLEKTLKTAKFHNDDLANFVPEIIKQIRLRLKQMIASNQTEAPRYELPVWLPIKNDNGWKSEPTFAVFSKEGEEFTVSLLVEGYGYIESFTDVEFDDIIYNIHDWFTTRSPTTEAVESAQSAIEELEYNVSEFKQHVRPLFGIPNSPYSANQVEKLSTNPNDVTSLMLSYNLSPDMFEGWMPGGKQIDTSVIAAEPMEVKFEFRMTAGQVFKSNGESYAGLYPGRQTFDPEKPVYWVHIVIPFIDISDGAAYRFQNAKTSLASIVDHELGHFVQEVLQVIDTGLDRDKEWKMSPKDQTRMTYGLPSKKLSKPGERNLFDGDTPHALRDVEFYTRLSDSAASMKQELSSPTFTEKDKMDRFKYITGYTFDKPYTAYSLKQDPWLFTLKQKNTAKWGKAVKELYKMFFNA